ncbi:MAG: hypothetical protein HQL80_00210 [Magnetococcales bacterium]|nr:hypothetical protein [Magnetococcales bacterium]MBF0582636.1 hypothetical protein [Magnetococcales bacterium]
MADPFPWTELFGWLATLFTAPSLLPQIWKTWHTRSARDLSFIWLAMSLLGTASWTLYGLLLPAIAVAWTNLIIFLMLFCLLVMKLRFS